MIFKGFIKAIDDYCSYPDVVPAPVLRKTFDVGFKPEKCTLRVCVAGFYELYINGKNITKGLLAPFINNPDHVVYYDDYDVSNCITIGKNALGVILGNGFANQDTPYKNYDNAPFRAPLVLALTLEICGEGKKLTIDADESFKVHPSPIIYDMYRLGTVYDARLELPGFAHADFDDSLWNNAKTAPAPRGKIAPSTANPIKEEYELKPISIEKQEDIYYFYDNEGKPFENTYVKTGWCYDFGYSRSGVCRLKIKGERGQKVILRHCECLKDGKFNMNSIHTVNVNSEKYFERFQADTYILKGGEEEIFIPPFTYHGFRYVLVEGITESQATEDLITFVVFNTKLTRVSEFTCSDEILNTLYSMAIHSDLSNYHHFPTDCPHREKCGWTGDISVSAHQLALSFDCVENMRMWLESARYSQTEEGMLPCVIPTTDWGYSWGNGPVWDSAIVNVPYYIYKYYGREDIVTENADMILRYLKYISEKRDSKGLIAIGLGDWCQPGKKDSQPDSPLVFTDTSQIYETALKSAFLFEVAGMADAKEYALNLAGEMKNAIRENLIDFTTMTVAGNCQTSQAVAIKMGIFEDDEKNQAYQKLLEIIRRDNRTINCGMIGLRNIFHVLADNGDMELALEMITKKDAPSYRDMIDRGGTALFESLAPNGFQESRNHHFYGDIINLFITKILGLNINPDMNDIYKVSVKPYGLGVVDGASATYTRGDSRIVVKWAGDNTVYIHMEGKFHGTVDLDGKIMEIKEGLHEYTR